MALWNFLTGQDTDFEGGDGDWVAAGNCNIANTTAQAHGGAASLALTASGAGNMQAASFAAASILPKGLPVVPGEPVRAAGWLRAYSAAKSVNAGVDWFDAAGTNIGVSRGSDVTDSTSAWTQVTAALVAPANAAFCRFAPQVKSAAGAGEVHYVDDAELNPVVIWDAAAGRVGIDLTVVRAALGVNGTATIARSIDQIVWSTIRGGSGLAVTTTSPPVWDYEFTPDQANYYRVTASTVYYAVVTPALGGQSWLKNIRFPFLNLPVTLADMTPVTRVARSGLFGVIGRSRPVAVTSVRGPATFDLAVRTETSSDAEYLRACLASGEIVFLQTPATTPDGFTYPAPTGYYHVGDAVEDREGMPWDRRTWTLPLTEVDPPDPSIVGTTITWAGVASAYASWSALVADKATWADVTQLLGVPGDVVVP